MKHTLTLLAALLLTLAAGAQTMNIKVGQVIYAVPGSQAGDMTYSANGDTLNVMGKPLAVADIDRIYIDNTAVTDNTVSVSYEDAAATVTVAGSIMQYVSPTVSGAYVSIAQSESLATEITYTLSGTSTQGNFYMSGKYKATVTLDNLTLTSGKGYAVNIDNGKRIDLVLNGKNTLADYASGSQKGCLIIKGHTEVKGSGTLTLTGNAKHAFKGGEYVELKKSFTGEIIVAAAAGDGLHIDQYLRVNNGKITVQSAGDDGIQVEATNDLTDEENGQIILAGGTVDVTVSAADVKGIKCDSMLTISDTLGNSTTVRVTCTSTSTASKGIKSGGEMYIKGGDITVTTAGKGMWEADATLSTGGSTSACACLKSDSTLCISGGRLTLTSTGSGGKGINVEGKTKISGGVIIITTSGGCYYNNGSTENTNYTSDTERTDNNYYSSPKGIKSMGDVSLAADSITVSTKGVNAEGIESKNDLEILSGVIYINAYDDGINSTNDMHVRGGDITVISNNNDGLDANGNLTIHDGTVRAFGAGTPECGLDADERHYLYILGGYVLAVGGGNNTVTATTGSQAVVDVSGTVTANTTISVTPSTGSTTQAVASFTVPADYTGGTSQGGGRGGFGGGGGSSRNVLISAPTLQTGTKYSVKAGTASLGEATAATSYRGR